MSFVIDMNLTPGWIGILKEAGWDAVHCWLSKGAVCRDNDVGP